MIIIVGGGFVIGRRILNCFLLRFIIVLIDQILHMFDVIVIVIIVTVHGFARRVLLILFVDVGDGEEVIFRSC